MTLLSRQGQGANSNRISLIKRSIFHYSCSYTFQIMAALLTAAPPIRWAPWQTVPLWGSFINSATATTNFFSCQKQGHVLSNESSQYSREEKCHHLRKIPSLSICLVAFIWFFFSSAQEYPWYRLCAVRSWWIGEKLCQSRPKRKLFFFSYKYM